MAIALEALKRAIPYPPTMEQAEGWHYHNNIENARQEHVIVVKAAIPDPDIMAIRKALQMMILRHESLRTVFRMTGEQLQQCVLPYDESLHTPVTEDVSMAADKEEAIMAIINAGKKEIRLDMPPLFKCYIFKVADNVCYIALLIHHIISDGWSVAVIYKEFNHFYTALVTGRPTEVPPMKMQLRDYAQWQIDNLAANKRAIAEYWEQKLGGLRGDNGLAALHRKHAVLDDLVRIQSENTAWSRESLLNCLNNSRTASYVCHIEMLQYKQMIQLMLDCKASIGTLVNTGLQLLFFLLLDKDKTLIAMPLINRYLPGTQEIIGCLGGGFYLYREVKEEMSVRTFIKEVHTELLQASTYLIYEYRANGFDGDGLRIYSDVFINYMNKEILNNMKLEPGSDGKHTLLDGIEYYGLTSCISECQDGLSCDWKYNTKLYAPEMISLIAEKYRLILQVMCENPDVLIKDLKNWFLNDMQYDRHS